MLQYELGNFWMKAALQMQSKNRTKQKLVITSIARGTFDGVATNVRTPT